MTTTAAVTRSLSADRKKNNNQSISVKDVISPASAAALATGLFGIGAMTNPGGALRMLYPSSSGAASATTSKDGNVRILQHIIVELWFPRRSTLRTCKCGVGITNAPPTRVKHTGFQSGGGCALVQRPGAGKPRIG